MAFIPRIIEKFLDLANQQRHNDNFADIKTELDKHDTHEANTNNPHNVTAIQAGAAPAAHVGTGGNAHAAATPAAAGFISAPDKTKLDGIADGAEVNQNAFSTISVAGQGDVIADFKTDTLTFAGGIGIAVTTDPATDKVTITATGDAAPGAHASTHITGGSDVIANAVAGGNAGLLSGADKTKLDGVQAGATNYIHPATHPASIITVADAGGLIAGSDVEAALQEIAAAYPINAMSRQAIINGNYDVWQRGISWTNPVSANYLMDRWRIAISNSGVLPVAITHSRQSLTPGDIPSSYFHHRLAVDGAGSGFGVNDFYAKQQLIENGARYLCGNGKKVTISFWARSSINNKKIGVRLIQSYGGGGSPSPGEVINGNKYVLTPNWTKYTYTFTTNTLVGKTFGTLGDDYLALELAYMWGSTRALGYGDSVTETFGGVGNIDIAQVQINSGDVALPYQPKSVDAETKDALRYAWIPQLNSVFVRASSYTVNTLVFDVPLPVQLRTTPTIRGTVNTDIVVNTIASVAQSGFTASAALTSNGVRVTMTKTAHGITDGYLEIKTTSGFESDF